MTLAEAETVAAVINTADGECTVCTEQLAFKMQEHFPHFNWLELTRKARGW